MVKKMISMENILHIKPKETNLPDTWLKTIIETAEMGICIINSEGYFCGMNQIFYEMFGYSSEELIGSHFLSLIDQKYKDSASGTFERLSEDADKYKGDYKVVRKDGSTFVIHIAAHKLLDQKGSRFIIATVSDISDKYYYEMAFSTAMRISSESVLAKSAKELYKIIHETIAGIMPANNFYIAIYNGEDDTITFPYLIDELDDDNSIIFEASENKGITAYIIKTNESMLISEEEISHLIKNNIIAQYGELPKVYLGIPLTLNGISIGVMALQSYDNPKAFNENDKRILELISQQVARYIERKNYEKELIEARMRAEDSNRIKSEFLAQMSHEIRTPINSILSFNSLLREELHDKVNEDLKESFQIIDNGGRRLIRTIDLLLNVSEVQTGTYKPAFTNIDLDKEIIGFIINELKYQAEGKNLTLRYYVNTTNTMVYGDCYTIAQMFINLIENAIKYTIEGRVWVSISLVRDKIRVEVKDTGIGISKEFLPHLFENFSQEETGYTRKFDGNGLGLALVKKYAELNNALITVESEKGKGSIFTVTFDPVYL